MPFLGMLHNYTRYRLLWDFLLYVALAAKHLPPFLLGRPALRVTADSVSHHPHATPVARLERVYFTVNPMGILGL